MGNKEIEHSLFDDEMTAYTRECEIEEQMDEDKAIHEDEDEHLRGLECGEDY